MKHKHSYLTNRLKLIAVSVILCMAFLLTACSADDLTVGMPDTTTERQRDNKSTVTRHFVPIGRCLYYDPDTMIVWLKNGSSTRFESPVFVPYIGPNGLPYSFDKETNELVQTHGE